jgi:hypothetical protein
VFLVRKGLNFYILFRRNIDKAWEKFGLNHPYFNLTGVPLYPISVLFRETYLFVCKQSYVVNLNHLEQGCPNGGARLVSCVPREKTFTPPPPSKRPLRECLLNSG